MLRNLLALGRRLSPQARFLADRLTPGRARARVHDGAGGARRRLLHLRSATRSCSATTRGRRPATPTAADFAAELRRRVGSPICGGGDGAGLDSGGAGRSRVATVGLARLSAQLAGAGRPAGRRRSRSSPAPTCSRRSVERPRPEGGLVEVEGFAYPSGHASHAVDLRLDRADGLAAAAAGDARRARRWSWSGCCSLRRSASAASISASTT